MNGIEQLEVDRDVNAIHSLFQRAYTVEAKLIGVNDFPPLQRSRQDLTSAGTEFYGVRDKQIIVGAIEIHLDDAVLDIVSLAVDPDWMRRGYAVQLVSHVLSLPDWRTAIVQTAKLNTPATSLYEKLGFQLLASTSTPEKIDIVKFNLEK